jgi:hypothetical protein
MHALHAGYMFSAEQETPRTISVTFRFADRLLTRYFACVMHCITWDKDFVVPTYELTDTNSLSRQKLNLQTVKMIQPLSLHKIQDFPQYIIERNIEPSTAGNSDHEPLLVAF